ncbi:hypothetical protein [Chthonobacter rhizosphaerae]|uniref:hypothetical protein n=1 Tax=Chthonobacter rhizosphaerae TaxID=2735553 RepID=UPI0015EFD5E1|nr:hypothetical protein [Chthonobacter rhizosphaerae]
MTSYMQIWMGWKAGKISDDEVIARMHADPFFRRWFEARRAEWMHQRRSGAKARA